MSSTPEPSTKDQTRTYDRARSVVFLKTNDAFGGLSNMAGGYPLHVQGTRIYTSEALYQACRFPHLPEVQRLIIGQTSPMTAKMKSKPHRNDSRPDWDRVRVKVMRWCLRVKLAQNWAKFSDLLLRTGDRPIVEESRKDDFWGAKSVGEQTLVGMNVLGRLLMELREAVKSRGPAALLTVEPLGIPEFLLFGRPIGTVVEDEFDRRDGARTSTEHAPERDLIKVSAEQSSLFETPAARERPSPTYVTANTPKSTSLRDLKPYPAMKDTGVPWLGQVPEHWDLRRIKTLFREKEERSGDGRGLLLSLTRARGLLPQSEASNRLASAADLSKYKVCQPGDLVMNRMQAWSGMFAVSVCEGLVSPDYSVFVAIGRSEASFFEQLFKTPVVVEQFAQVSKGIGSGFNRLYTPDFGAIPAVVPPLPEQTAIVRFLDHADRRIRRYIRAKQKLIKLLEEQKQAIIRRAVTRGLDPSVRLKPSGVEWLGDVPVHWEVARLKDVSSHIVDCLHAPRYTPKQAGSQRFALPISRRVPLTCERPAVSTTKLMRDGPSDSNQPRATFSTRARASGSGSPHAFRLAPDCAFRRG
jgi:type I restriction enzyme, S subunit